MSQRGVVLYLHVHQPWRIKPLSLFDVSSGVDYFFGSPKASQDNELLLHKIADKSYRPMNQLLLKLLRRYPDFKISLSITGTFIEQLEKFDTQLLNSFKELIATGQVEILAETYYHSLSFFYNKDEFEKQVEKHRQKIKEIFNVDMPVFRNTELAYNNDLAKWADEKGYRGILAEGWDKVLGWRSPNYIYRPVETSQIRLLMKNYKLSDDIAFRFSDQSWSDWPLSAETYVEWLDLSMAEAPIVNLFMDYETFGEHQWSDTGIFDFFERFVGSWLNSQNHKFYTVSEAIDQNQPQGDISVPYTTTWADNERDLSAWLGNDMQREALTHLYDLAESVMASGNANLINDWRRLQSADHMYYMSTKRNEDGNVHTYFSPYESPYDAFLYFMNAVRDIEWRVKHNQTVSP